MQQEVMLHNNVVYYSYTCCRLFSKVNRVKKASVLTNHEGIRYFPIFMHKPTLTTMDSSVICRARVAFGCCRETGWRVNKPLFIPKRSRRDYSTLKSYRPISPFILKTPERLVVWDGEPRGQPLYRNQQVFYGTVYNLVSRVWRRWLFGHRRGFC